MIGIDSPYEDAAWYPGHAYLVLAGDLDPADPRDALSQAALMIQGGGEVTYVVTHGGIGVPDHDGRADDFGVLTP